MDEYNEIYVDKVSPVYDNEIMGLIKIKIQNWVNEIVRKWGVTIISVLIIVIFAFILFL